MRFEGGVLGRADDMTTVRGVNVYPMAIENLIVRFPEVLEYRITLRTVVMSSARRECVSDGD